VKLLAVLKKALEAMTKTPTISLGNNVGLPLQSRMSLHGSNVDGSNTVDVTTTNPATTTTLPHGHKAAVVAAETTDTARIMEIILPQEPPLEPPLEEPHLGNNKPPLRLLVVKPVMATVTPRFLRHLQLVVMVLLLDFPALLQASSPCITAGLLLLHHLPQAKALLHL
jgi:hypothetical protein